MAVKLCNFMNNQCLPDFLIAGTCAFNFEMLMKIVHTLSTTIVEKIVDNCRQSIFQKLSTKLSTIVDNPFDKIVDKHLYDKSSQPTRARKATF